MTSPETRHLNAVENSEDDRRGLEEHIECLESKAQDLAESNKDLRYLLILASFAFGFTALFFIDEGYGVYAVIPLVFALICVWGAVFD